VIKATNESINRTWPQGVTVIFINNTVFTWLISTATTTLVSKISVETIQTRPLFNTGKRFLSPYSHNQLWPP